MAVGAPWEDSGATGINGDQADNSEPGAGAVYIFARTGGFWSQQAYLKASNAQGGFLPVDGNTGSGDRFGSAVALSADGSTLVVGALGEDSSAMGTHWQADNSAGNAGAVYVFKRASGVWSQHAYVKASNAGAQDLFGSAVAISADGNTFAVGAPREDSGATGVGGNEADNSKENAGAVYVFTKSLSGWLQQAYVKASNTGANDLFGSAVALSADGTTLAVGALEEDSSAPGIGGNQADNSAPQAGSAYILTRNAGTWSQQAYVKASNTGSGDLFGGQLVLSADGNTLVVAAEREDSNATGIGGNQSDNSVLDAGAVYIFARTAGVWSQQAYVKASNTQITGFGPSLALSADGHVLAVGAEGEDSSAIGIGGDQVNKSAKTSGAVYVFELTANGWLQKAYVKASNTDEKDLFGSAVALSADGSTLAVGARWEDSSATGVGGNQMDNSKLNAGAVYLY